jgi:hypothetical protein
LLQAAGASERGVGQVERIVGRLLSGETVDAREVVEAQTHAPDLIRRACELHKPVAVVRRLAEFGWDVDVKNRTTALHEAVMAGSVDTVETLIELGANRALTDDDYHTTPAVWAEHFGYSDIRAALERR